MASKAGPDTDDKLNPGDTQTNPAGASSPKPAKGADETPPPRPGLARRLRQDRGPIVAERDINFRNA